MQRIILNKQLKIQLIKKCVNIYKNTPVSKKMLSNYAIFDRRIAFLLIEQDNKIYLVLIKSYIKPEFRIH